MEFHARRQKYRQQAIERSAFGRFFVACLARRRIDPCALLAENREKRCATLANARLILSVS
jgi:hypothetical protein